MGESQATTIKDVATRTGIPDDVSVGGHDELPWMSLLAPGITVSAQPIYEMGQRAINLLMARIHGDTQPVVEVKLTSELIVRPSVAQPARHMTTLASG